MMFLALGVASVYANGTGDGNLGLPILGTTGVPALAAPSLFSGAISVLYADGTPVVLATNVVTLNLCATTCQTVTATLKQTAPGTYTYTFTPPTSVTGTVTIYIQSGTLADDNGKIFPSVDTQIGTYATPSSSASSPTSPAIQTPPATQTPQPESPALAVDATQTQAAPASTTPIWTALVLLVGLLGTGFLLIIPRRH
jgi:hypothetical protein